jgi:hypothetical protein
MCISGANREGCVWIILNIRIGMVTHITMLLGMYVVKGLLEREWYTESFKELCIVVSVIWFTPSRVSRAMYSASDICMRVFSAKDKNIDILRGEAWSPTDVFL